MDLQQAIALIKDICARYNGTLQEHITIQNAVSVIESKLSEVNKLLEKEVGNEHTPADASKNKK